MKNRGPLYVLICYILWGLLPAFWKLLREVDSLYVLAARIVWSLVLMVVILTVRHGFGTVRAVLRNRKEWLRLTLGGCCICVNWGVFIWAVNNGHMMDSSLAYYMNPILSILLGTVFFHERLSCLRWLAVGVTFTGLVVAIVRFGQIPWIALVIGGSFAVYGAVKKGVHVDADISMFFETATLAPFALAVMLWMEIHGTGAVGVLHGAQWLLLPLAGVITTVPLLFFAAGIRKTPMTVSGILMYINPTLQLLMSVLLFREEFTTTYAILFGFVWSGLALYVLSGLWGGRSQKESASCE